MALDVAIRAGSRGKNSLDDVMRDLYNETNGKDGFSETRIRELCVKYGGEELGLLYDECVTKPVRIPIEGVLAGVGLTLSADGIQSSQATAVGAAWPFAPKKG
jgi:predicted metalloprotease with PDZ domain